MSQRRATVYGSRKRGAGQAVGQGLASSSQGAGLSMVLRKRDRRSQEGVAQGRVLLLCTFMDLRGVNSVLPHLRGRTLVPRICLAAALPPQLALGSVSRDQPVPQTTTRMHLGPAVITLSAGWVCSRLWTH